MILRAASALLALLLFLPPLLSASGERITVHALKNFPPQYTLDSDGQPTGFAIEIIEAVAQRANLEIEYLLFDSWADSNRASFEEGIGDVVPNSGITPQREAKALFSTPIETIHIQMFRRTGTANLHHLDDIADRHVGVVIGNVGEDLIEAHPHKALLRFRTKEEALNALLSGRIDILIYPDTPIMAMIQQKGLKDQIAPFGAPIKEIKRAIRVRADRPDLLKRLDSALQELLRSPDYLEIYQRWHPHTPSYRDIGHIRSASELDYPPFSIVLPDGRADGFSVALMRAALEAMGKEVSFEVGPWSKLQSDLASGQIDALPLVGRTPERELLYDFTTPYIQLFGGIVVRKGSDIQQAEDLKGRAILVMRGDNAEEFLRREQISDHLILTTTFEEAFKRLSQGEGDAVVVQQLVAQGLLKQMDLKNLKLLSRPLTRFRQDFCFAVQRGNWELLAILNEGLAIVRADGTYDALHREWFDHLYDEPPISTALFYLLLALMGLLAVALVILWFIKRALSNQVAAKTQELQSINKTLEERVEQEVSRRLELERERQAQASLLIQQSKMAAMGEMIGAIAHQWKQPLNAIALSAQNALDMIAYDEIEPKPLAKGERVILEQVAFMAQTIDDFKNFFSPTKERVAFDARHAVEHILRILSASLKRRSIEVKIEQSGVCDIVGYPNEFKQAVFNLISNAKDALEEREIEKPLITIRFSRDQAHQMITISDNAGGIDEALLPEKLFEPHVTTKGEKGTGIGLQICKMVLEKSMGGTLEARNQDQGAAFIITLPLKS